MGKLGNYIFADQTSRIQALLRKVVNKTVTLRPVKAVLLSQSVQDTVLRLMRKGDRT